MAPIYEYLCDEGHVTERLTNENLPRVVCETCGKPANKKMSSCSFVLKGDGWGKDGYSKKKQS